MSPDLRDERRALFDGYEQIEARKKEEEEYLETRRKELAVPW